MYVNNILINKRRTNAEKINLFHNINTERIGKIALPDRKTYQLVMEENYSYRKIRMNKNYCKYHI